MSEIKKEEKKILNEIKNEEEEKIYQLKVNKDNKQIIIMYMLSGDEIILTQTVNIISDSLLDLYNIIQNEIKRNNFSMSINDYLYTHDNFTTDYRSTLKDTINRESSKKPYEQQKKSNNYLPDYYICYEDPIDNKRFEKHCENKKQENIKKYLLDYCKDNTDISSLLDEDYNNNYTGPEGPCRAAHIKVSIIFSFPMHYIKKTINDYFHQLIEYSICIQLDPDRIYYFYYKIEGKLIKININNTLIYNLSKLDNNCIISLDNYEEIKVYIKDTYDRFSNHVVESSYEFVLNEIKKYLAY